MTNFREMARKAQAAYEAKKAERDTEEAYARQARSRSVDQGIDLLNQQVMPLLEQAKNENPSRIRNSLGLGRSYLANLNPQTITRRSKQRSNTLHVAGLR
jgi:hypothetical protein